MSILIKGMEMPTTCGNCPVHKLWPEDDGAQCMIKRELWTKYSKRNPDCPLIEIPDGHGRLIDADALIEDLERQCKEVFRIDAVSPDDYWITRNEAYNEALWKTWVESFDNYLKTRQTVIPADKDGET